MILVTLGTQDKSFDRLLAAIDKAIENKIIKDKVIVQACLTFLLQNHALVMLLHFLYELLLFCHPIFLFF